MIAELAQSLFEMSEAAKHGDYCLAERTVNLSIVQIYSRYPNMEDKDIKFILDIIEDYQRNLINYNRVKGADECGKCD